MPLLDVRGLSVQFGNSGASPVHVVRNLSVSIGKGTIFGLAGESGCGKSMTALALMGILPKGMRPSGSAEFNGRDLLTMPSDELRSLRGDRISMIFQEPMTSLNPVLRVGFQIAEVLTAHKGMDSKRAESAAIDLMRAVRIPSPEIRSREYPHQMSGGMRQRVMMAMAIACGPDLLIADEPTTALDVTIEAQILELLRTLRDERGMSVLLITHDLGVLAENAETVGIMYAGRLMELAPVRALFESPAHPYTAGLMKSMPTARGKRLEPIAGVVPKPSAIPAGCAFSDRCAYVKDACRSGEPELLEVAPGHTSRCIRFAEAPWKY